MPVGALVGEFFMQDRPASRRAWCSPSTRRPIFGLGTAGGFEFYIQNRGEGGAEAPARGDAAVHRRGRAETRSSPACRRFWRANVPQLYVDVDREKAKALGVPVDDVFNTLAATLGSYYVNDFNKYGRTWQVLMSAEPALPQAARRRRRMYVRSRQGRDGAAALRSRASSYTAGPDTLERFNNLPAVKMLGSGAPGVSSGEAIAEVERIAREVLPPDFSLDWGGASYQEKRSGGTSVLALGARRADGVPDPRGAVREVVAAALGAAGAAVRHVRRAGGGVAART